MFCCQHCSQLLAILFSIVMPDYYSAILLGVIIYLTTMNNMWQTKHCSILLCRRRKIICSFTLKILHSPGSNFRIVSVGHLCRQVLSFNQSNWLVVYQFFLYCLVKAWKINYSLFSNFTYNQSIVNRAILSTSGNKVH